MSSIIQMIDVEKHYGDVIALKKISLNIEKGEFLTVLGSSGCGKTTLLKMINGLVIPDSGQVIVDNQDVSKADLIALRRSIGYCIQGNVLFPHLSVEDNIAYVPNLLNGKNVDKTRKAVSKWLKLVGLDESIRPRFPSELSGGQQQRVGLARSLASSPDILLMDEPFGAVDSITRSQLQKEIKAIHSQTGVTIVFVTHDIREALFLGSKVLVLDSGCIQQFDTPINIVNHPANAFVSELLDNNLQLSKLF